MLRKAEIRAICEQGVEAVEATIRQLYEMLEEDDERVQRLVAAATAAHLKKIEELTNRISRLEIELLNGRRQIHQLQLKIKDITKQVKEAKEQTRHAREAHLASVMKNSQNSSLPPSADSHKRTRSLREKSGPKAGGQTGHLGTTLEFAEQPNHVIVHTPKICHSCGSSLNGCKVEKVERRQIHDLPPLKIEVTEHQSQTIICHRCGMKNKAGFPQGVNAPVQYGEGVKSVAAYLLGYQLLPYERCAEAMNDLFNCRISVGTLATLLRECAGEMVEPLMLIAEGLRTSEVVGADETNLRVCERLKWIHVSSTDRLTLLVPDERRGATAIERIGVLSRYEGIVVHDGFGSYEQYQQCVYAQCNAHILRELNYVVETSKPDWAMRMKALLLEIKAAVDKARKGGKKKLSPRRRAELQRQYDASIEDAKKLYGTLKRKRDRTQRLIIKESPMRRAARKLARRLEAKRDQVLLFMNDLRVPFDNNQSERDLRMLKVKQKISGCFRTEKGAGEFCKLRGYVSTMKKQGRNAMEIIKSVFAGKTIMPHLRR